MPERVIDLAVDANGEKYTDHTFAQFGDPWWGATILTPGIIIDLRKRGLLPLTEVSTTPAPRLGGEREGESS